MDYYTQKIQQTQQHRSSFDSRMESPRLQNRMSFEAASAANHPNRHFGGAADQLRASFDARDLPSRATLDMKDAVRASFQKERSLSSVDGRDGSRQSPRFGGGGPKYKEPSRSSVDGGRLGDHPLRSSLDSPRLSMRIREAVRAAVEGRMDSVRSSSDGKDSLRSASSSSRPREASVTPRIAATGDSRLLVELRESPRLSRDAPRYSCDGRDGLRSTQVLEIIHSINQSNPISRGVQQKGRDSPRLSVDGRGAPPSPAAFGVVRPSVEERESPRLLRELLQSSSRESSLYNPPGLRSDNEGRDRQLQQPNGEPRRRVPSLVARLMGLEDLPEDVKQMQMSTPSHPDPQMANFGVVTHHETAALVPPQSPMPRDRKPSKESKLLKELLQYNPQPEGPRSMTDSRPTELDRTKGQMKQMFGTRPPQADIVGGVHDHYLHQHQRPTLWNGIQEASPRQLKLSPKQLGVETMPHAYKHQEGREMSALRQKLAQGLPKQLTEAVLTVLKNADDSKRMPMNYSDMENRLRQLRLRSSLQEHKTLRQILEAMHTKGLLNRPSSRPKDVSAEEEGRKQDDEARQQQESRHQYSPKQIVLPKPQECISEAPHPSKVKRVQDSQRLGSRLHEQVFGTSAEDRVKPTRPQFQQPVSKPERPPDEQQQSIVVMKPISKPAARAQNPALVTERMPGARSPVRTRESPAARAQNPALVTESMPGARSPVRTRETRGRPSPANRSFRTQPEFGLEREATGGYMSEEGPSTSKLRRARMLGRSGVRDAQSDPNTPRTPKLISLPQSTGKQRTSSVSKETPDGVRQLKVNSKVHSKVSETGRSGRSNTSSKEEVSKTAPAVSSRSQCGRDHVGLKSTSTPRGSLRNGADAATLEAEPQRKSRRSSGGSKLSTPNDRATGPGEVVILRNKSSNGRRVALSDPETRASTTTAAASRRVVNGGSKARAGEKTKEKTSSCSAPTTPRGSTGSGAERGRKQEEEGNGTLDHVRVTDGDALDQSSVRSPLGGLTNRLQSTEVGLIELDRDGGQGLWTPRAGILVKKVYANQEGNAVSEKNDIHSEQAQPSPVSVLDTLTFNEEDVSPLALTKPVDGMQGLCNDIPTPDHHIEQRADTALQDWRHKVYLAEDHSPVDECSQQLLFLRESAKILPPQGEGKSLILDSQAEKVYVRDVLVVSGATTGLKAINPAGGMIDNSVFDYLEAKQRSADSGLDRKGATNSEECDKERESQGMDRRMLFDCVNDALTTVLVPYVHSRPWMQGLQIQPLCRRPTGQILVQQLWDEMNSLPPEKPCADICDSLYSILQKDLALSRNSWTEFNDEIECIGLEVEKMIFKDLVEEILFDLTQNRPGKKLFAR